MPNIFKRELIDDIITISKEEAFNFTRRASKEEGLFIGISTGASFAAINKIINRIPKKSKVLTIAFDTGERYLSVLDLF